ncbi:uncharacterized protein ASCRUDRAFT_105584 [Ascoidea rubescens DSM 1968]|uniref:Uncharacterized protein n=1 Tax=Ascoidea rubescens DSM 1968 TaxID=1344418 RepID=A0A1D2VS87_9ASCO|nr:hypothetical protein ASCRUDRAFT_105584 [Ascoidea rubescens DSM 1968]ODV64474.1 hypothetical protein ASCRUDRAFT_105584 [Ascoidea rubescens DSM 1968]
MNQRTLIFLISIILSTNFSLILAGSSYNEGSPTVEAALLSTIYAYDTTDVYITTVTITSCSNHHCSSTAVETGAVDITGTFSSSEVSYVFLVPLPTTESSVVGLLSSESFAIHSSSEIISQETNLNIPTDSIDLSSSYDNLISYSSSVYKTSQSIPTNTYDIPASTDDISTTIITTSTCLDNQCNSITLTTGLTTVTAIVENMVTVYTTFCPLTAEKINDSNYQPSSEIFSISEIQSLLNLGSSFSAIMEMEKSSSSVLDSSSTVLTTSIESSLVLADVDYGSFQSSTSTSTSNRVQETTLTSTFCSNNNVNCETEIITTGVTTVTTLIQGTLTIYTTYCPIEYTLTNLNTDISWTSSTILNSDAFSSDLETSPTSVLSSNFESPSNSIDATTFLSSSCIGDSTDCISTTITTGLTTATVRIGTTVITYTTFCPLTTPTSVVPSIESLVQSSGFSTSSVNGKETEFSSVEYTFQVSTAVPSSSNVINYIHSSYSVDFSNSNSYQSLSTSSSVETTASNESILGSMLSQSSLSLSVVSEDSITEIRSRGIPIQEYTSTIDLSLQTTITTDAISTNAISTTVFESVSCFDNNCETTMLTTGLTTVVTTVNDIITSYTTYCPLSETTISMAFSEIATAEYPNTKINDLVSSALDIQDSSLKLLLSESTAYETVSQEIIASEISSAGDVSKTTVANYYDSISSAVVCNEDSVCENYVLVTDTYTFASASPEMIISFSDIPEESTGYNENDQNTIAYETSSILNISKEYASSVVSDFLSFSSTALESSIVVESSGASEPFTTSSEVANTRSIAYETHVSVGSESLLLTVLCSESDCAPVTNTESSLDTDVYYTTAECDADGADCAELSQTVYSEPNQSWDSTETRYVTLTMSLSSETMPVVVTLVNGYRVSSSASSSSAIPGVEEFINIGNQLKIGVSPGFISFLYFIL